MLENLYGPQVDDYQKAMGRATLRHSLLTNNLANVNTPGYKRRDIDFNITLTEEQNKVANPLHPEDQPTTDSSSIRVDGNNVDLEREVMSMSETELRYQTLTDMTTNYFSQLKSVIQGTS